MMRTTGFSRRFLPAWPVTALLAFSLAVGPARAADEWQDLRAQKAADDLRIEAAAAGAFGYSKTTVRSSDGLAIPAYLFTPLDAPAGKTAAVIYVHGGQHGQFNSRSLGRVQALLARGWVVLAPDYRSSSGYSREFFDAADYGGLEIDDMLAARDYLVTLPQVDPARIAILGLSHGGYNTLMALARAPGTFAAGVDFFGPTDLAWRLTANPGENPNAEDGDRDYFARMVGKSIDDAPELYRARSPRFLADRIVDPVLILHGEKDSVVLVQESEWMAAALTAAGHADFALHVIRDGQHGYPEPQMDEAWTLALQFLGRVLAVRPDAVDPASATTKPELPSSTTAYATKATPRTLKPPEYPDSAKRNRREGWVILSYAITSEGRVADPIVEDSSGVLEFEKAAIAGRQGGSVAQPAPGHGDEWQLHRSEVPAECSGGVVLA